MVVDERVRVGSLAGPLRSLESAGKRKVKRGKHRKRQYKVRAQRQPSILTKGRAMPRWYGPRGRGQAIIGPVRRLHAVTGLLSASGRVRRDG